jgi:DNA-binding IclR family transcriptional regulator
MLARLSPSQVRALYPDRLSLILRNEAGPRTLADLTHLLTATRARGFAMENGEVVRDFASVGAAATDASGYPAAAIGLTFRGPATDDAWNALGAIVTDAAGELSSRLTGRPHTPLPLPS